MRNKFLLLHIIFPILIGAVFYYLLSPDVIFVKQIDELLGCGFHLELAIRGHWIFQFMRIYMVDMLWGYALVFALFFIVDSNAAGRKEILFIAMALSAIMEILQLTPLVQGTFDLWDILVEFLAEMVAVFIINKYTAEEVTTNEKKE